MSALVDLQDMRIENHRQCVPQIVQDYNIFDKTGKMLLKGDGLECLRVKRAHGNLHAYMVVTSKRVAPHHSPVRCILTSKASTPPPQLVWIANEGLLLFQLQVDFKLGRGVETTMCPTVRLGGVMKAPQAQTENRIEFCRNLRDLIINFRSLGISYKEFPNIAASVEHIPGIKGFLQKLGVIPSPPIRSIEPSQGSSSTAPSSSTETQVHSPPLSSSVEHQSSTAPSSSTETRLRSPPLSSLAEHQESSYKEKQDPKSSSSSTAPSADMKESSVKETQVPPPLSPSPHQECSYKEKAVQTSMGMSSSTSTEPTTENKDDLFTLPRAMAKEYLHRRFFHKGSSSHIENVDQQIPQLQPSLQEYGLGTTMLKKMGWKEGEGLTAESIKYPLNSFSPWPTGMTWYHRREGLRSDDDMTPAVAEKAEDPLDLKTLVLMIGHVVSKTFFGGNENSALEAKEIYPAISDAVFGEVIKYYNHNTNLDLTAEVSDKEDDEED
ncbi:uncharacterized protein SPPG_05128 [Spizellomyces punctatus DAOM BR117]|uniref:G-patch domain-containing protein n=1 Tax=Spizellomyces punctatus (strain DAOM BR117) TaxID=645134 RepID=A0A0L0HG24_SPIPD|nr:uncharacterized protein SPPG_05128 [Spizellomyces punctatus DAOM BR117]KNC99748.1 hypothetical protein SPPG_05128 [Spizellomyces punctatus DAOM BR117]|eukprot:XP_016607788.1 hypothetical protein SPPG_05128 [Spizellomyces punctatus DAOM BR117]